MTRHRLGWTAAIAALVVTALALTSRPTPPVTLEPPDRAFQVPARLPEVRRDHALSLDAVRRVAVYQRTVRAFAYDLARTGRVPVADAKHVAEVAVAEAYRVGIPPALVLGVMAVESDFTPQAVSSVGAVGYMQVMPEVWGPLVRRTYGDDLRDPDTNVRAGIAILAHYAARTDDWRALLLKYNGCVRGTVTPHCFRYPEQVRRAVERVASYTCPAGDFARCVAQPLNEVFLGAAAPAATLARTVE